MKSVLWLPSWYPNKTSAFDGDFIQRHARAVSLHQPVQVIFVIKDTGKTPSKKVVIEQQITGNLTETIAYINPFRCGIHIIDRLISFLTHRSVSRQLVRQHIKRIGMPRIVHVHVALWAGITALWIKRKFKVPYVVTEHWTGYHSEAQDNLYDRNFFFRKNTKEVLEHAAMLLPVSKELGNLMTAGKLKTQYRVIPNVVDTELFMQAAASSLTYRFVHVSAMNYQKNAAGLLRAFAKLLNQCPMAELVMIGSAGEELKLLSQQLDLEKNIVWTGEISYPQVALAMQNAACLILFSHYENLPCVVLEALCCGLPVLSSCVGGIPEVINEKNGILVNEGDEHALSVAMHQMLDNYVVYNKYEIANAARRQFNYETIGKSITDVYEDVLYLNSSTSLPN